MWAIQIVDGKRGIIYLREALLDGRILLFDKEEVVLRFMAVFKDKVETALGVRLRPIRYCDDPKKDNPYKVPDSVVESLAECIYAFVSDIGN